ncbi:MAG: CNNM domain-containing protein [Planctomycetota bacterium]
MFSEIWPYLPGALALLVVSGFFSGSEAAFFSLTPTQRRKLSTGMAADRAAATLLARSERLLMGILFWNLGINIAYFSLVSKAAIQLPETYAALLTILALITIIVFGEFFPKSISVTYPLLVARTVVFPLSFAVRIIDFCLPLIRVINEGSRRLLWPGFKSEAYLDLADLDRAVELSSEDDHLFEQESQVLRNVIRLSEIRVEEWMRPRTQYRSFKPPVSIENLGGERTPSGYMLVTDAEGREVQKVIDLSAIRVDQISDLSEAQQPLVVVPWCASVADALTKLKASGRRVALVVNEYGESIGILTWEEIFEAILQADHSASQPELAKAEIHPESEGVWIATGTTKLRRLERVLGRRFEARSLTIGGVIQDRMHRLAEMGDECEFEGLHLEVLDAGLRGEILVRVDARPKEQRS